MPPVDNEVIILTGGVEQQTYCRLESALTAIGLSVQPVQDARDVVFCLQRANSRTVAVILCCGICGPGEIEALREIKAADLHLPLVVISERSSPQAIVLAMKNGASDFLPEPVDGMDLASALKRVRETDQTRPDAAMRNGESPQFHAGSNPRMRQIQELVGQIAWSGVPVLIQGETGTGKEVLARDIHNKSQRANMLFLKLNCAALPAELVESELFGYERGAFTGALRKKPGMFELADGGTLLLDEIGDMDVRLQAKLLQVLQDQEFRRVGGTETVKVDVRLIAATHRDLEQAIRERTFREDLYYRLNVVNLKVPPLRERKEDLVEIAEFLIRKYAPSQISPYDGSRAPEIDSDLKRAMMAYDWPGNIRELENCMRRLAIFRDPGIVANEIRMSNRSQRPTPIRSGENAEPCAEKTSVVSVLEQAAREKERADSDGILKVLTATRWNRKQAAQILNIDYKSLLYKMKKLGIENNLQMLSKRAATGS